MPGNQPEPFSATPRVTAERIAWSQDGLVTLAQAHGAGMSKDAVYRLVRAGSWGRVLPGVLRVGPERGWRQQLLAACLRGVGATAASHRSAGALYELEGVPSDIIEVTCLRSGRSPAEWLTVHETATPFPIHHVGGIPVTPIARTLVDLASVIPRASLELALEDALRRRLTSIPTLRMALPPSRGRRGLKDLRELIDAGRGEGRPTDSALEARVLQALAADGFPKPLVQYQVLGSDGFRARLDSRSLGRDRSRFVQVAFGPSRIRP